MIKRLYEKVKLINLEYKYLKYLIIIFITCLINYTIFFHIILQSDLKTYTVQDLGNSKSLEDEVNVKDFGAYGDANYYNPKDGKYYIDSSFNHLSHDDTKSVIDAIDYLKKNDRLKTLFFPGGNYYLDQTIEVNGYSIEGENSKILSKAEIAVKVLKGNDRKEIISRLGIVGINKVKSIGILCTNTNENTASVSLSYINIFNFENGISFSNNSYLYNFRNIKVADCNNCIVFPNNLKNSGENISFYNSVFSAKDKVVDCGSQGEINFFSCSFDYFQNKAFYVHDRGMVYLDSCHIEGDGSILRDTIIDVIGEGSSFKMIGGQIILVDKSNTVKRQIQYILRCDTGTSNIGAVFDDVTLDDCNTTSRYFSTGNSIVKMNNITHYEYSKSIKLINKNANLLQDGSFEFGGIKDSVLIDESSQQIKENYQSSELDVNIDDKQSKDGIKSLKITKKVPKGTKVVFYLAIPIDRQVKCSEEFYIKSDCGTGKIISSSIYGTIKDNKIVRGEINDTKTLEVKSILNWNKEFIENNESSFKRSPQWAKNYIIKFDITDLPQGSVWIDDLVVNQIN